MNQILDTAWIEEDLKSMCLPSYHLSTKEKSYWLMNTTLKSMFNIKGGIEIIPIENGKPNKRVFSQLDEDERRLFEDISTGAGLWSSFGLKRTTTSQEEIDDKDFELLRGEYLAGNNNPQVIVALRKLVVKLMTNGRMKKSEGMDLLMELSV